MRRRRQSHVLSETVDHARYFPLLRHLDGRQLDLDVAVVCALVDAALVPKKRFVLDQEGVKRVIMYGKKQLPALRAELEGRREADLEIGLERNLHLGLVRADLHL